jgi:hypothetical protein
MQARRLGLALVAAALAAAPAAVAVAEEAPATTTPSGVAFSGKTEMVEGPALQLVFGQRAVFHLDDKGAPVLDAVETGPLALAHPLGTVTEAFEPPGAGKLAIALDGSPQKKASYLKVWNGLDHPVLFRAGVLAYEKGVLTPATVRVCATPGGGTSSQTWPAPIAAVVVASFTAAKDEKACS